MLRCALLQPRAGAVELHVLAALVQQELIGAEHLRRVAEALAHEQVLILHGGELVAEHAIPVKSLA